MATLATDAELAEKPISLGAARGTRTGATAASAETGTVLHAEKSALRAGTAQRESETVRLENEAVLAKQRAEAEIELC